MSERTAAQQQLDATISEALRRGGRLPEIIEPLPNLPERGDYYIQTEGSYNDTLKAELTTTYHDSTFGPDKEISITEVKLNEIRNRIYGIETGLERLHLDLGSVLSEQSINTVGEDKPAVDSEYPLGQSLDSIYLRLSRVEDMIDDMIDRLCI